VDEGKDEVIRFSILELCVSLFTDDLLVVDHEPQIMTDFMASHYTLKPAGSVKELDSYLGTQVSNF
jgi:hypothetical protein